MAEIKTGNIGSASHTGENQVPLESHFIHDYTSRRVPLPVFSFFAVADAGRPLPDGVNGGSIALERLQELIEPQVITGDELVRVHMEQLIKDSLSGVRDFLLSYSTERGLTERIDPSLAMVVADDKHAFIGHTGSAKVYMLHNEKLYDLTPTGEPVQEVPGAEEVPRLFDIPAGGEPTQPETDVGPAPETDQPEVGEPKVETTAAGIRYNEVEITPGDVLILCTDGLWNTVSEEELVESFLSSPNIQRSTSQLTRLAFSRDSSDNATMVAWQYMIPGTAPVEVKDKSRRKARRDRVADALLVALLALVLVGVFAIGFALGWRITDTFRKPQKEAARESEQAEEPQEETQQVPAEEEAVSTQEQVEESPQPAAQTAIVNGNGVRMRDAADSASNIVGLLRDGQLVTVLEVVTGTDGKSWTKTRGIVRASGEDVEAEGFIRSDFLVVTGEQEQPASSAPAP